MSLSLQIYLYVAMHHFQFSAITTHKAKLVYFAWFESKYAHVYHGFYKQNIFTLSRGPALPF